MSLADIRHHSGEARQYADAADREAAESRWKEAKALAEVSQAHSLAALATAAEGNAEPRERIAEVLAQCKRFEDEVRPRTTEGLPNDIARAQGELQACELFRELLEQELPPEECP